MMYPSNSSNDLISNYPIRPSSSSSTSKQEEQLPLLPPPPPPFSFFQFPYSPFEDTNEIFQQQQHHHDDDDDDELLLHLHLHLHHHHQQQSLPPPNMEQVSIHDTSYAKPPPPPPLVQEAVSIGATKSKSISNPADKPPGQGGAKKGNQIPPVVMRRRSNKRDRHSKINTARGLRDRRMRLSLDVAKRFFGLQDMLGFDKASKTVDWLLDRSKAEIKQLAREKNHPSYCSSFVGEKSSSSTSDCEGVSSLDEVVQELGEPIAAVVVTTARKRARGNKKAPRKKSAFNHIGKESREKARERARERTREKKKMMTKTTTTTTTRGITNYNNVVVSNNGSSNLGGGGSWNPFETVEESGTNQTQNLNPSSSPLDLVAAAAEERSSDQTKDQSQQQHLNCVEDHPMGHEEDSFVIMNKLWSPTMILNSLNNSTILQEHQFGEFQSMGIKPWEAYNNNDI